MFRKDPEVQRKTNKIYAFYSDSVATSNQALPDSLQMDVNQTQEMVFRLTSSRRDKMYVPNIDSWKSKARKFIAGGQTHLDYGKDSQQADHELIEHYGIMIDPYRSRKPLHLPIWTPTRRT